MPRTRTKTRTTERRATVIVQRASVQIAVEDVPLSEAGKVAGQIIRGLRQMADSYPELVPDLAPVGGGTPIDVSDDPWAEDGQTVHRKRRRVGF